MNWESTNVQNAAIGRRLVSWLVGWLVWSGCIWALTHSHRASRSPVAELRSIWAIVGSWHWPLISASGRQGPNACRNIGDHTYTHTHIVHTLISKAVILKTVRCIIAFEYDRGHMTGRSYADANTHTHCTQRPAIVDSNNILNRKLIGKFWAFCSHFFFHSTFLWRVHSVGQSKISVAAPLKRKTSFRIYAKYTNHFRVLFKPIQSIFCYSVMIIILYILAYIIIIYYIYR